MKDLISIVVSLLLIAVVIAGFNKLSEINCMSMWSDSGFGVQYGFLPGCRIQTLDGKWIPADNYREVK